MARAGDKKLTSQFGRIVSELIDAADEIARLVEEGERQAEIRRRQWEEERRLRQEQEERARRVRAREDARKDLMQAIDAWGEVQRIQAFLSEAEIEARRLEPEERDRAPARIALARALIGKQPRLKRCSHGRAPMSDSRVRELRRAGRPVATTHADLPPALWHHRR